MDHDLRLGLLTIGLTALAAILITIIALATSGCKSTPVIEPKPHVISASPALPGVIVTDAEKRAAANVAATGKDIAVRIEGVGTPPHSDNGKANLTLWGWMGDWLAVTGTVTALNDLQGQMQVALIEARAAVAAYEKAQVDRDAQVQNLIAEFTKKVEVIEALNLTLIQQSDDNAAMQARLDVAEKQAATRTWIVYGVVGALLAAGVAFVWLRFGDAIGKTAFIGGCLTYGGIGAAILWKLYAETITLGLYIAGGAVVVGLAAAGITWAVRRKQLVNVVRSVQAVRADLRDPIMTNGLRPEEVVDGAMLRVQTPATKALVREIRFEEKLDSVHK